MNHDAPPVVALDDLPLHLARARYFAENGFPADGGYDAAVIPLRLGPVQLVLPNTAARVKAVRFHDLHHLVTGYGTSWTGEAEIGAWEIASGCGRHHAAWLLNLWAMALGLAIAPRAIFAAFRRGRRSRNLYHSEWSEALLEGRVADLRRDLGIPSSAASVGAGDLGAFAGWAVVAVATLAVATLLSLAFAPLSIPYLLRFRSVA